MQQFTLKLGCGHDFTETAVDEHKGKPYKPNYLGRTLKCQVSGCWKLSRVKEQQPPPELEPDVAGPQLMAALTGKE